MNVTLQRIASALPVRLRRAGVVLLLLLASGPALAQYRGTVSGNTVDNSGIIPFDQAFFAFEVENPLSTLKEVPTWDELEQALDNPYGLALAPDVRGNFQGWPSYRSTIARRRSFIFRDGAGNPCAPGSAGCTEVPLAGLVTHPLNYNFQGGEELRLLNINFAGADWQVPLACVNPFSDPPNQWTCTTSIDPATGQATYTFDYTTIGISPGLDRLQVDEAAIDYNSPMNPYAPASACVTTVEPIPPPEGSILCGGDTGEPGYAGFGVLLGDNSSQYSVPAVPGGTVAAPIDDPNFSNAPKGSIVGLPLFDPARGTIAARVDGAAVGGLRRPSLRAEGQLAIGGVRAHAGTPTRPDYLANTAANVAIRGAELPSNENDYYRGATRAQKVIARNEAAALGKALFWDMQVGSDSVQACASCHFHAGADNRIKGQINSGINGGDTTTISVANTVNGTLLGQNAEVTVASFPLHKLIDPLIPTDPLVNPGNIERTTHATESEPSRSGDVLSSMGVSRFKLFGDIPAIGVASFLPPGASGVSSLRADYACGDPTAPANIAACVPPLDPVSVNQGFRRVEPRHTPTFFAATMNFDNFWDGRARHDFNGGSVFGASDPQAHVWACQTNNAGNCQGNTLAATRQIIRFVSLASLSTGPALSEFEMSFAGRNWAKLGKRLLQSAADQGTPAPTALRGAVTPLANQLVDTTDSVLGLYSNQGGSACAGLPAADRSPGTPAAGKPGLCISYPGLIRRAYYQGLWGATGRHLNGCYTDDLVANPALATLHPNQCAAGSVAIPVLSGGAVVDSPADPFDRYVLTLANGAATKTDTNQFTQMEANMSLFFGLAVHAWGAMLIPDDTPFDRFMDGNPDAFVSFGEANENALVIDLPTCGAEPCFTEIGNFKRDPGVIAKLDCPGPEGTTGCTFTAQAGTRTAGSVDPLLGMDFFLGSNLSLKNGNFNTLRCGECHAGGTMTDMTVEVSHQLSFNDWAQEFSIGTPGSEIFPEPLGRGRVISGFALEGEINGTAQDAVERNVADLCTIEIDGSCRDVYGNPVPGGVHGGFPQGQALFDNGVYNIGVTPIGEDGSRGGNDAFGWPLSLSRLALKNLCGVDYTPGGDGSTPGTTAGFPDQFAQPAGGGIPCPTFDPSIDPVGGGVFEETAQDQGLNPGFEEEPADPQLLADAPYLAPWASNINVGDEVQIDEVFVGINTLMEQPMLEGFIDSFGPFNPAAILGENMNNAVGDAMATWPNVNRVNVQGAFKAAPLRNIELTNPYFHDGGNLTLRQQLDFYTRGGNFPITNKAHRDFLVMNLLNEDEALGACVVPSAVAPICDPTQPLGSQGRVECVGVSCDTAGSVPMFSAQQKEEIIVAVVDFLLELTDDRVKFEMAPFDHPEIFVPLDATAPENGVLAGTVSGNREGLVANTDATVVCTDSTTGLPFAGATTACFRQVPAVGAGGTTALPNFLGISSGPRLVGPAAFCGTVNNHYCH
ncbi:MAG TPA: cytochrome c peroxidase [Anaeromyxobacteraceae bacterium]|nr:cytochrome c peroxidase [Anaeromyxobacteraceae bacterium]